MLRKSSSGPTFCQSGVHMRDVAERVPGIGDDALMPEMEVGGLPEDLGARAKHAKPELRI
jgi:hypothetical protein